MLVAEKFIRSLVDKYRKHIVYTDGGTWYNEAYSVIGLKYYLNLPFEKSFMERVNQYFKDRTEFLVIIIHILLRRWRRIIVIYHMYTIGLNYSSICIIQQLEIKYHLSDDV